jgi:hypothetical protein
MSRNELLPAYGSVGFRADESASRALVVLIEVPELRAARVRTSPAYPTGTVQSRRIDRRRPRRKLRREVRMVARALLGLAPFIGAGSIGWSLASKPRALAPPASTVLRIEHRIPGSDADAAVWPAESQEPSIQTTLVPAVVLSIEPVVVAAARPEAEEPVVFPGYLLPADVLQESGHEGN